MDITSFSINALGFAATTAAILMWIPQARTTLQNRNDPVRMAGVSETTQWMVLTCNLLWGAFGVVTASFWVAIPAVVACPIALVTIVIVRHARRMPPATRAIPIISIGDSLDVGRPTEPISIIATQPMSVISTEASASVDAVGTGAYPTTGTVPILV